MNDETRAKRLEEWLATPPGTAPPEDLDEDVLAAVYALRPDRAPAARVTLDDILGTVTEGPFAPETTGATFRFPSIGTAGEGDSATGPTTVAPAGLADPIPLHPAGPPKAADRGGSASALPEAKAPPATPERRRRPFPGWVYPLVGVGFAAAAATALVLPLVSKPTPDAIQHAATEAPAAAASPPPPPPPAPPGGAPDGTIAELGEPAEGDLGEGRALARQERVEGYDPAQPTAPLAEATPPTSGSTGTTSTLQGNDGLARDAAKPAADEAATAQRGVEALAPDAVAPAPAEPIGAVAKKAESIPEAASTYGTVATSGDAYTGKAAGGAGAAALAGGESSRSREGGDWTTPATTRATSAQANASPAPAARAEPVVDAVADAELEDVSSSGAIALDRRAPTPRRGTSDDDEADAPAEEKARADRPAAPKAATESGPSGMATRSQGVPLDYNPNWYLGQGDVAAIYASAAAQEKASRWAEAALLYKPLYGDRRVDVALDASWRGAKAQWAAGDPGGALSTVATALARGGGSGAFRAHLFVLRGDIYNAQGRTAEARRAWADAAAANGVRTSVEQADVPAAAPPE